MLRAQFHEDVSFLDILDRVKNDILEAIEHQDIPFERIVEEVLPQRDLSRSPLFQVMFDLQKAPFKSMKVSDLELELFDVEINVAKFDLLFLILDVEDDLQCTLEYNTDLFKTSTIERMADYFATLLKNIARDPERPVSEISLLTREQERRILVKWNNTATDYPRDKTVQALFEKQAAERPNDAAVKYGGTVLSYSELNERANKIAHYLKTRGVAPADCIALYLERSIDMIAAILGIIKAGACYVPLDLAYPKARLAFMVEDVKAPVLITQQVLVDAVPAGEHEILVLDAERDAIAKQSGENPNIETTPTSPAYIIYTSGSTGRPKGVVVPHRAIIRLVINTNYIELGENDCIAQVSNAAFDAATFEIWGALLNGGKLIGISKEIMLSSQKFVERLREEHISAMFLTVAYFSQMVREEPGAFKTVNTMMFGGEAADVEAVRLALKNDPPNRLLNGYGPTENTTFSACYKAESVAREATNVPIGKPIANSYHYVLDKYLKPCPVNVPGELYLGGDGLALGYYNRPELNEQKFVVDPFRPNENVRLYRTGDLVRWLPDGNVEFLGRIDRQVKIRGFRIELGEIGSLLKKNENIDDAVLVAWENKLGEKQLVAYTVSSNGADVSANDLKRYLSDKLPDYMIPTFFVNVDAIPINANGKIDKHALPDPTKALALRESEYMAPRNKLEKYLVHIWQDLLGVEHVGVYDNFFDLGGNSLKAAMFMNKMQKELGETTHVAAVFKAPRIAEMAVYMAEYFPDIVGKMFGHDNVTTTSERISFSEKDGKEKLNNDDIATFRRIIRPLPPRSTPARLEKNPKAVFLLSPPRSGSTLLRVMLAGNRHLFSPPELDLLSFNTLQERKNAFSGNGLEIWLQATVRAIMEIKSCNTDEAAQLMTEFEDQNMPVKDFYWQLQQWLGDRILVDKTPTYPFDLEILKRAEQDFEDARYIHLVRHPYAMIYSFIEAKLDQNFFRYEHPFSRRELAELIWLVSNQNILEMLKDVPQERQHRVRFEDLLVNPRHELERICEFLDEDFQIDMLKPYEGKKMTDGATKNAQMVGDFKFYLHKKIEKNVAERWRTFHKYDFLSDSSWKAAERLGYQVEKNIAAHSADSGREKSEAIAPAPRDQDVELSFAQQRLWFLNEFDPGNPHYNIPLMMRMVGRVQTGILQQALDRLVERHESLRTIFVKSANGEARQRILPGMKTPVIIDDLSSYDKKIAETLAGKIAAKMARTFFDLSRGPLIKVRLVKKSSDDFLFIIVMHHIISDGWSVNIFMHEFAALHESILSDSPSPLPPLTVQYADYAQWQRKWLQGKRYDEQLAFWKKQLHGLPAALELPVDFARPAVKGNKGRTIVFRLPRDLSEKIRRLSRIHSVTPFMTLLAAFEILIAKQANQKELAVGTPIAGRTRNEIEPLIGFFVNTLVMRADLTENLPFIRFLDQVKQTAMDAYSHQDIPFEKLVDAIQPVRDMAHTPLFQVMFAMQDDAIESLKLTEIQITPVAISSNSAKFDISMTLMERYDQYRGQVEYDTELFSESTIQRFIAYYQELLISIANDSLTRVMDLNYMPDAQIEHLLRDFAAEGNLDYARDSLLHKEFEIQAARTPDAAALVYRGETMTYAQLNARANQLASFLHKKKIGPEQFVGLSVDRSFEMIVGLLGILKAGAAYVPLDPGLPDERMAFTILDTGMSIMLVQGRYVPKLQNFPLEIIALDDEWKDIAKEPADNLSLSMSSENVCYVIYTSGSTGKPKGVLIQHRSVLNFVANYMSVFGHGPEGRILQYFSYYFDGSVGDIFPTLFSGAALYLVDKQQMTPEGGLISLIQENHVNFAYFPPAMLSLLPQDRLPGLQAVASGGDVCTTALARTWATDGRRYFNGYGPTETTVCTTLYLTNNLPLNADIVPIGRPLKNYRIYILDESLQPVPVGIPGEMYIGGECTARGYLNRPELTAGKFIPDPFSENRGARMYVSGDLCRWLEDGNIEFLGRIDNQVKLRGFRIELGEIESVLMEHKAIRQVACLAREEAPGDKRLVAYFTSTGEEPPSAPELRQFLKPMLPEYMIPSYFVALEKFPLTLNGKLDRTALPKPQLERRDLGSEYREAQTETEKSLTKIWKTVLGVDSVGIDDNFFELGGDSILSIQVITRAQQKNILLTPRQFFESPTIRDLAVNAAQAPKIHAEQGLVVGDVPLTPIQKWFFEQDIPNRSHWNQSLLLKVNEKLDSDILEKVTTKIIEHHDALRLRFRQSQEGWKQQIAPLDESTPFAVIDLSAMESGADEALRKSLDEQQKSLDISTGPIFKMVYYRMAANLNRLFIVIHHTAVDGLSWRILLEDIGAAYDALARGEKSELPAKTTSCKYWAEKLYDYAASEQALAAVDAWNGMGADIAIPVDVDNGANTEASSKIVSISLSESETFSLLHEVNSAYQTRINDILLTALIKAFAEWSGEKAVLIDLEGHGRESIIEDADISRTVGWFTTLYPVLLNLSGRQSLDEEIKAVKKQLAAIPRNGIDYGIVKYLAPESEAGKKIAAMPQPRIAFNYLGQFSQSVQDIRFQVAEEYPGSERDPGAPRSYQLFVSGKIMDEKLQMSFIFSENLNKRETIEAFADDYRKHLSAIIEHCRKAKDDIRFSSDIGQYIMDDDELEDLLVELD